VLYASEDRLRPANGIWSLPSKIRARFLVTYPVRNMKKSNHKNTECKSTRGTGRREQLMNFLGYTNGKNTNRFKSMEGHRRRHRMETSWGIKM